MLKPKGKKVLLDFVNYRVLTPAQISALGYGVEKTARRFLAQLMDMGLVQTVSPGITGKIGRPGVGFTLTSEGVKRLRSEGAIDSSVSSEDTIWKSEELLDHQLLMNWVGIHFRMLGGKVPGLETDFLSSTSPLVPGDAKIIPIFTPEEGADVSFSKSQTAYPDAVANLHHLESGGSLLFFIEADRGTESLRSRTGLHPSIESKVRAYQSFFVNEKYRYYEKIWNTSFKGFRLLFVTISDHRSEAISLTLRNLTPDTRPWMTDFIWTTSLDQIQDNGIGDRIWAKGTDSNMKHSILGEKQALRYLVTEN